MRALVEHALLAVGAWLAFAFLFSQVVAAAGSLVECVLLEFLRSCVLRFVALLLHATAAREVHACVRLSEI